MCIYNLSTSRLSLATFLILAGLISFLPACSGGGGGGAPGAGGILYNGVTTPASLTTANANYIFSAIWNGGYPSGSASSSPAVSKAAAFGALQGSRTMSFIKHARERLSEQSISFTNQAKSMKSPQQINNTYNGKVSGTETDTGSIDPATGTGTLTVTYVNFNDGDGYTYDGAFTVKIDAYDMAYDVMTDWTMSCTLWTVKSTGSDVSLSGSIREQRSLQNNTDTLTMNIDGRDNIGNETFRFENYVETAASDDVLNPSNGSETYSGRVYIGRYGYVDISTVSPCVYSDTQGNPDNGGPIVLAGAENAKAAITPLSASFVLIEIDDNGDGIYDDKNVYAWSNLEGAPITSGCIANAGPDQAVSVRELATLDGSGSMDLGGEGLSYLWAMTAKPAGSSAVLYSPSEGKTTFVPDKTGNYTITLIVSNGTTSSSPDTVLISAGTAAGSGPVLASISVTPADPSIAVGMTQQFIATGMFSDNSSRDLTAQVSWSSFGYRASMDSAVPGLAHANDTGPQTVMAWFAGMSGSTTLTVLPASLLSIQVSPNNRTIARETIQHFNAAGRYSDGSLRDITSSVTWSSSNMDVASISNGTGSNGQATATVSGGTTITATLGGISGVTALTVTDWPSSPGNYVYLQSDSGDYIGLGNSYGFTSANAQFSVNATGGHLSISVTGNQTWWGGDFAVPNSISQLQVGYYGSLTRYPFNDPVVGGLEWHGDGRGCNTLTGWFAIDNSAYNSGNLASIDLRFEQHCEGASPALYGWIHWAN